MGYRSTRPPSLTYWCLGEMLEPYVRHGVQVSGEWHQVTADDIPRGHIIFVTPTALKLLKLAPNNKRVRCTLYHCA